LFAGRSSTQSTWRSPGFSNLAAPPTAAIRSPAAASSPRAAARPGVAGCDASSGRDRPGERQTALRRWLLDGSQPFAPVVPLALGDLSPADRARPRPSARRVDQVDRQDHVVAPERPLARDEQLDLLATVGAAQEQGGQHRQEEARPADHLGELLLPLFADDDAFHVLNNRVSDRP
jgi:hypothetical protein